MLRSEPGRRTVRGAATGLVLVVAVACAGPVEEPAPPRAEPETIAPAPSVPQVSAPEPRPERRRATHARPTTPGRDVVVPAGRPERVVIPAIGVDASLVELGLQDDGAMEVPDFGLAGWYALGPPPGHPGPALIAAHVDSRAGPDVFYRLRELTAGDEVLVRYDTGDEVAFVVESAERLPKDELPGDRIWPVTADRLLALITCGGEFDRSVRHYRDNIIVYTVPAEA